MFLGIDSISLLEESGPGSGRFLLLGESLILLIDFRTFGLSELVHFFVVLPLVTGEFFPFVADGFGHFFPFLVTFGSFLT